MDCVTEMVSDTIQEIANLAKPGDAISEKLFFNLCFDIARARAEDTGLLADKLTEFLSLLDNYQNPPRFFLPEILRTVEGMREMIREGHL